MKTSNCDLQTSVVVFVSKIDFKEINDKKMSSFENKT